MLDKIPDEALRAKTRDIWRTNWIITTTRRNS